MISCRPKPGGKIFYNPSNGYTIAVYETEEELPLEAAQQTQDGHSFTAVGLVLPLAEELMVDLEGEWKQNEKYGIQYEVKDYQIQTPTTREGMIGYLSSGLIKGIGPVTAEKIVDKFGRRTFYIIENEPERLLDIRGITEGRLEEILAGYRNSDDVKELMTFLAPMGATPRKVAKIQDHFGKAAASIVKENPYRLCEVRGFGFKTVDPIAMNSRRIRPDNPFRLKAAIRHVLEEAETEGHLFLHSGEIVERVNLLLNHRERFQEVPERAIRDAGNGMVYQDKELVADRNKAIYLKECFQAEKGGAVCLSNLIIHGPAPVDIEPYLKRVEKLENIMLDEKQKDAVRMVFRHGVSLITGGPGYGKTTVIRVIIGVQEEINKDAMILLCAPTGRARRRMYESTHYPALTIHKAIGAGNEFGFGRKEELLPDDLIITDESSMLDMFLAYKFFSRIKRGARLVLVGDKDQIPSVRAGNVFKELLECGVVPKTVLTTCFRQGKDSTISANAERINKNIIRLIEDDTFRIIPASTDEAAAEKIREIYKEEWNLQGKNADAIQVLSPLRKDTQAGADALNEMLCEIVNPRSRGKRQIKNGGRIFQIYDKVMQEKNNDEVSNGDIGMVIRIYREGGKEKMEVDFGDERQLSYEEEERWPLTYAYAISVHKSQGSEYPVVILPMLPCFRRMLKRNILYTAVSRAQRKLIIVGSRRAIAQAIHTDDTDKRNTMFGSRIREIMETANKRRDHAA